MSSILFTAGNCPRCKITKRFMDERVIDYDEVDIKGGGMETFQQFYKANRDSIFRTKDQKDNYVSPPVPRLQI